MCAELLTKHPYHFEPSKLTQMLTLLAYIWEVFRSNLSRITDYFEVSR